MDTGTQALGGSSTKVMDMASILGSKYGTSRRLCNGASEIIYCVDSLRSGTNPLHTSYEAHDAGEGTSR